MLPTFSDLQSDLPSDRKDHKLIYTPYFDVPIGFVFLMSIPSACDTPLMKGELSDPDDSLCYFGTTFRDHKVLNKKYDNIKKRTTKKFADEKAYVGGTGRGSQQSIEATDVDVAVKEILGAKPMGHSSEFDGDSETTSFQSNSGIICLMTKMMIVLCQKIKPEQFREKCLLWIK
ncbi:hypothetical protein Zmor_021207 [Zophobas morio]|uniref:Uncharacterized protein n=1 Tax=Zophobas morio TaxID=2755281 RepID=A0AA38I746_9CUCU|nr:hypothetical protein Zmor_021207 [Zophobas morio]